MKRPEVLGHASLTWILFPRSGAIVPAGPVRVSGLAAAPDGVLRWEVRDAGGGAVAQGSSVAGTPVEFHEFGFTTPPLPPGDYTVEVWLPEDTSPGATGGERLFPDSRTITVR